jgi:hypothetical protein
MVAINQALEEMEAAEKAVERGEEGAIARLASAQEQVEATDGYRVDEMIAGYMKPESVPSILPPRELH